jgi:DNA-binding NarL/FixJ family response regulator
LPTLENERLVEHGLEEKALDLLLAALKDKGLVAPGGKQRTNSTHVISAVRDLNRLELAGESVRAALEALSAAGPVWLADAIDLAGWRRRYCSRIDTWRSPASEIKRAELATAYGTPEHLAALTACEREVMALAAEGRSNTEIAEELFVSPLTVRTHIHCAMTKLDARDSAQLVVIAYQHGLVRPTPPPH